MAHRRQYASQRIHGSDMHFLRRSRNLLRPTQSSTPGRALGHQTIEQYERGQIARNMHSAGATDMRTVVFWRSPLVHRHIYATLRAQGVQVQRPTRWHTREDTTDNSSISGHEHDIQNTATSTRQLDKDSTNRWQGHETEQRCYHIQKNR